MGRNIELTNAQRKLICLQKEATSMTNRELSHWATEKFAFTVSEMTISRTLKRRDQWISGKVSPDGKRVRKVMFPEVEEATYAWFLAMQDKGEPLTDGLICRAAKRFYANLEHGPLAKQLLFSHGWLGRFKKRHGIEGYVKDDQIVVADPSQEVLFQMDAVKAPSTEYEPGDIFSLEGMGLLFALEPNKALAAKKITTNPKGRIFVGFTANMDGSMKLPLLVINKHIKPRAFTSRNITNPINLGVLWHANRLAWMSVSIFEKYLLDFENRMLIAGKNRVLLLVDIAHRHKLRNLEQELKITVIKFIPNSSGLFPPVDAGVIGCVKAFYRKQVLEDQLDCMLHGESKKVDIYNAVVFLEQSWRICVTPTMISTHWRHTDLYKRGPQLLLLENLNRSAAAGGWPLKHMLELNEEVSEISMLLELLGKYFLIESQLVPNMTAQEYIYFEEHNGLATFHGPSKGESWEPSQTTEDKEDEDTDSPVVAPPHISYSMVQSSLETIATYLFQKSEDVTDMLQSLRVLDSDLASHSRAGRQSDIAELIIIND